MGVIVVMRAAMGVQVPVWNTIVLVHVTVDAERSHESNPTEGD
jgi:hypothetical protein